jgi:hypothetical protein
MTGDIKSPKIIKVTTLLSEINDKKVEDGDCI